MFKAKGIVEGVKDGQVHMSVKRAAMCGCCRNIFCANRDQRIVALKRVGRFCVGDEVVLGLPSRVAITISCFLFFLPTLIFIGGLSVFGNSRPLAGFLFSLGLLVLYFVLLKRTYLKRHQKDFTCSIIGG